MSDAVLQKNRSFVPSLHTLTVPCGPPARWKPFLTQRLSCSPTVCSSSLRSLQLFPFNVKSLLRRAAACEALERYRHAYIDYKTALQIDCNIAAAHDGTNRSAAAAPFKHPTDKPASATQDELRTNTAI